MINPPVPFRSIVPVHLGHRVAGFMVLALAMLLAAAPAHAQGRTILVVGVAEASTGSPIPDADVFVPAIAQHARTNWLGEARIPALSSGTYEVRVRRVGFVAATVQVRLQGDSSGVTFMLERTAVGLDTVQVRDKALVPQGYVDFEIRRRMGLGRFLGPEELARERLRDFSIVAVSHLPGLMLVPSRSGQWQLASRHGSCGVDTTHEAGARSRSTGLTLLAQQAQQVGGEGSGARQRMEETANSPSSCFSGQPCHVKLFLDDQPVAESDINIVHTQELYGVEYYAIGNAPPRYRTPGAACGVMLLWSRYDSGG